MQAQVFVQHRQALEKQLPDCSLAFLFAGRTQQKSTDMDYPFCVNRNFYYMTGFDQPNFFLMLTKLAGEVKEYLFIDRPDPYLESYFGKMPDKDEVSKLSGIETTEYVDRFDWHIGRLLSRNNFEHLLFDFHKRELDSVRYLENDMCERIMGAYPCLCVGSISKVINNLRRIKCDEEVACIQKAVDITASGIRAILDNLADGVSEATLAAHFDFALTTNGATEKAFDSIIAGGKNSNVLHYSKNRSTLRAGDMLLVDLGAEFAHYAADISRTFPVSGKFSDIQRTVYGAVLHAQEMVIKYLAPGKPIDETLKVARDAIGSRLMEAGLISTLEEMQKVLPHGVCHYVGLDCHDVGDRDTLSPGMIVTVEPGAYLPALGFGVRIEDDCLITESGAKCLSSHIPKSIEEIETYLAKHKNRIAEGPLPMAD